MLTKRQRRAEGLLRVWSCARLDQCKMLWTLWDGVSADWDGFPQMLSGPSRSVSEESGDQINTSYSLLCFQSTSWEKKKKNAEEPTADLLGEGATLQECCDWSADHF